MSISLGGTVYHEHKPRRDSFLVAQQEVLLGAATGVLGSKGGPGWARPGQGAVRARQSQVHETAAAGLDIPVHQRAAVVQTLSNNRQTMVSTT